MAMTLGTGNVGTVKKRCRAIAIFAPPTVNPLSFKLRTHVGCEVDAGQALGDGELPSGTSLIAVNKIRARYKNSLVDTVVPCHTVTTGQHDVVATTRTLDEFRDTCFTGAAAIVILEP